MPATLDENRPFSLPLQPTSTSTWVQKQRCIRRVTIYRAKLRRRKATDLPLTLRLEKKNKLRERGGGGGGLGGVDQAFDRIFSSIGCCGQSINGFRNCITNAKLRNYKTFETGSKYQKTFQMQFFLLANFIYIAADKTVPFPHSLVGISDRPCFIVRNSCVTYSTYRSSAL